VKAAYLGSHMEYWVSVEGLPKELFAVCQEVHRPLAAGDPVAVTVALSGAALVAGPLIRQP